MGHMTNVIIMLQITTWLRDSAGKFLETRIDVGVSMETVEDLLTELGEFQLRAKVHNHCTLSVLCGIDIFESP